jgi:hypothetical protein
MVIILCLYIVALWVIFSKFKLVRWGWLSGTVSVLVGAFILATFLALVAIPVRPNAPVKANDVLFQIDPAPFQYKVSQLRASLAAKQQTEILKANYDQASANVVGLTAQVAFNAKRLGDIQKLAAEDANTQTRAGFRDRWRQYDSRADSGATG